MTARGRGIVTLCVLMVTFYVIGLTINATKQDMHAQCLIAQDAHTDTQALEAEAHCKELTGWR